MSPEASTTGDQDGGTCARFLSRMMGLPWPKSTVEKTLRKVGDLLQKIGGELCNHADVKVKASARKARSLENDLSVRNPRDAQGL